MHETEFLMKSVESRIQTLKEQIGRVNKILQDLPEGALGAYRRKSSVQYYMTGALPEQKPSPKSRSQNNGLIVPVHGKRVYLRKENKELIQQLAQKEYFRKLLPSLEQELALLTKLSRFYKTEGELQVCSRLTPLKSELIQPITPTDEQLIEEWMKQPCSFKKIDANIVTYRTANDELVRSKSEALIANLLKDMKIPYRYEKALMLSKKRVLHPDFTIFDVYHRREVYLEHLGMLDNQDYLNFNLKRIKIYEENGIFIGDRLILSFETGENPIDLRFLKNELKFYLHLQ